MPPKKKVVKKPPRYDLAKSRELQAYGSMATISPHNLERVKELIRDERANLFYAPKGWSMDFLDACIVREHKEAFAMLLEYRFEDVNKFHGLNFPVITNAVYYTRTWALEMLVAKPGLIVNAKPTDMGPLSHALINTTKHEPKVLEILLQHPDIDVDIQFPNGTWLFGGLLGIHYDLVRILMDFPDTSYRQLVKKYEKVVLEHVPRSPEVLDCIYRTNQLMHLPRKYDLDHRPCQVFLLAKLLQEGHFAIKEPSRFFAIISRVPGELQMLLANLCFDVPREFISSSSVEKNLKFMIKRGIL